MSKSLFSSSWYRVAELKPRLRPHAQIHRQRFRGQIWFVLQDHASGRFFRFSPGAHLLIGMMDGKHTVQEIWELAGERLGDNLPTQDEMIQLLGQLHSADVLYGDLPPDMGEVVRRSEKQRQRSLLLKIRNPMALRFPLIDPDRFLGLTLPLVRPLFGPVGFVLWLAVVVYGAILAGVHWAELTENLSDRVLATENIFLIVLTYPFVKAFHELGHGYAVKSWGGEVHEMGIMLLVMMPVPYVDASSSSAFREKWRRAVVGAAGIMVEMLLAALAMIVWLNLEPGLARATAFNVMAIAGVSTVLFNGNPLLRFDGYYVLADVVEIPNLGTRATKYLLYLIQRYLLGLSEVTSPATAPGERGWFLGYGITSLVYRTFIMISIAMFIATKFFVIGVLLAIWAAIVMFVVPVAKGGWYLLTSPALRRHRRRALAISGGCVALVAGLLLAVPVPLGTVAEGVVWIPENAQIHAQTAGVIVRIVARPNAHVQAGVPLLELEDPFLAAQVRVMEAQVKELELRLAAVEVDDRVQAKIIRARIRHAAGALALNRQRAAYLLVRSPRPGKFLLPRDEDMPGRFVDKGDLLAFVVDEANPIIRVIVPQADIDLVRQRTRRVDVRFVDRVGEVFPAVIERQVPAATNRLPSRALSTAGGGEFAIDPQDPTGEKTLETVFQLDLGIPGTLPQTTVGGRVFVRFDHGLEPVAWRIYRSVRQLFLSRLNV